MSPSRSNNMNVNTTPSSESSSRSSDDSSPMRRAISQENLVVPATRRIESTCPQQPADNLDEIDHFCHYLGYRLRASDRRAQFQLQIKIMQLIYDVEYGDL